MFNMKLIQGAIKLIPRVSFSFRCFYTTLTTVPTVPTPRGFLPIVGPTALTYPAKLRRAVIHTDLDCYREGSLVKGYVMPKHMYNVSINLVSILKKNMMAITCFSPWYHLVE